MNTIIQFVDKTSNLGPDGSVSAAQTGDVLLPLCIALCVLALSAALVYVLKIKKYSCITGQHKGLSSNFSNRLKYLLLGIFAVIIALCCIAGLYKNANYKAFANNEQNLLDAPQTINAYVDKENKTVTVDSISVANNSGYVVAVDSISTALCGGITDASNWNFTLDQNSIYNGTANNSVSLKDKKLYIDNGKSSQINITTDMNFDVASSLIGKQVLSVKLDCSNKVSANVSFESNFKDNDEINVNHMDSVQVELPATYCVDDDNNLVIKNAKGTIIKTAENVYGQKPLSFAKWSCYNFDVYKNIEFPLLPSITFTANYEQLNSSMSNITFDMNGYGESFVYNNLDMFSQISMPVTSFNNGLELVGWFKDKECTQAWDFSKDILTAENITLYAGWQIPINFVVNDPHKGKIEKKEGAVMCAPDTPYIITGNSIIIGDGPNMYWASAKAFNDFNFMGWEDSSGQTGTIRSLKAGTTFTANFGRGLDYFTLESAEQGITKIELALFQHEPLPPDPDVPKNDAETLDLSYSFDGENWEAISPVNNCYSFPELNAINQKIYLKGNNVAICNNEYSWTFRSNKNYYAKGNIMSLFAGDDYATADTIANPYALSFLFDSLTAFNQESKLLSCPNLTAANISEGCYYQMLGNCTYIENPPEISAVSAPDYSHMYMFYNCYKLIKAPVLRAEEVGKKCYYAMFSNCKNLQFLLADSDVYGPVFPAIELAESCYAKMFENCIKLNSVPILPAQYCASSCYEEMFLNCEAITTGPSIEPCFFSYKCFKSMFEGCTSMVDCPLLRCRYATDWWGGIEESSCECMFKNCVSLKTPALLPCPYYDFAIQYGGYAWGELQQNCCKSMYEGCKSLECAIVLSGGRFAWAFRQGGASCFYNCEHIEEPGDEVINYSKGDDQFKGCYENLFKGCESLKFVCLLDMFPMEKNVKAGNYNYSKCQIAPVDVYEQVEIEGEIVDVLWCPTKDWLKDVSINDPTRIICWGMVNPDKFNYDGYFGPSKLPEGWSVVALPY